MEELKILLQRALQKDIELRLYNYDDYLTEYFTITFNHLNDLYNNATTLHFNPKDEGDEQFYFYYWQQPSNKRIAELVKKICYTIAKIQQPLQKATSHEDGARKRQKATANKNAIIKLFDEHATKCKQIFNIKYNFIGQ